ncbi:MAG: RagB/SusD family nutrient uptake outer membrane protein [Cyclobacteriaceae bacterium]
MKAFKNIIRYTLVVVILFQVTSCGEDFMDRPPEDALVLDNFFRTEDQINAGTASLYGFPWFTLNDKALWCIGDAMSGNYWTADGDNGQFFTFGVNQNNPHLFEAWESLFRVIAYANYIINFMPEQVPAEISRELVNRAKAEGHFMRATAYFYMVRLFGAVPIIEDHRKHFSNPILPKHREEDIYTLIVRDLTFASEHLAPSYSGRNAGRVTSWAAKAQLAKVYLTIKDYPKAREFAQDVIQNSGRNLMPNYEDLFKSVNNNNSESLFALQWMACVDWGTQNTNQAYLARNSLLTGVGDGWGGWSGATIDLQNDFETGDRRRKATYMQYGDFYPELQSAQGGYRYDIVNDVEGRSPTLTHVKKYVVGNPADNDGKVCFMSTDINTYMIRLADAYLTYVEAAIGDGESTSDGQALQYFNAIRSRAGLPSKTSVTYLELLKERRTEFAFESQYWYDLLRYYNRNPQAALDMINNQERGQYNEKDDWDDSENDPDAWELAPRKYTITESRIKLPIPTRDVDQNPNLAPNVPAEAYDFQ